MALSTTSWISAPVPFKKTDVFSQIACVPGVTPGLYLIANSHDTGGVCLEWLRGNVLTEAGAALAPYDELTALAADSAPGAGGILFTPWLKGERSPVDDRHARAGFHNLSLTTTRADIVRSVLEGVAFNNRWLHDAVEKFANDVILPKVRDMDEAEEMDPAIVEQLFEQGLMGVEIPEEYGGAGMNFTSAIVGIEELARVDPSVSVLVDVHNTLVNTAVIRWGSAEIKKRFLPRLATQTVGSFCLSEPVSGSDAFALAT
jgi:hypothetical protein